MFEESVSFGDEFILFKTIKAHDLFYPDIWSMKRPLQS
jgi:hypothetical protein